MQRGEQELHGRLPPMMREERWTRFRKSPRMRLGAAEQHWNKKNDD